MLGFHADGTADCRERRSRAFYYPNWERFAKQEQEVGVRLGNEFITILEFKVEVGDQQRIILFSLTIEASHSL